MEEVKEQEKTGCTNCTSRCGKLNVFDWLGDLPESINSTSIVEVQFKNTRKGFFNNSNGLKLSKGDIIAVEASPGHDIGTVTLTGELVLLQMKKNNISPDTYEFKRVYRKAKPADIEKWEEAKNLEHETMLESRRISERLKLDMKIGDVEYQGDRTKAIFYYIADERVDFRELIKVLADRFKVRIEMRQIGARQEAGRIGGIGPCGRELCCSTWMTNFVSVTTNAARYQEISLNPQKLAGQCGKLKCCLNYELDAYLDAQADFPNINTVLETDEGPYYHFKTDIFKRIMWYSTEKEYPAGIVEVPVDRVKEVIKINRRGKKIDKLVSDEFKRTAIHAEPSYENVVGQDDLTRFDEDKKKKKRRPAPNKNGAKGTRNQNNNRRRRPNNQNNPNSQNSQNNPKKNEGNKPK
nr:regulatory iron-sulfur-containing complex subunit RicT [uncultured Carboxylicivirga sp.]